MTSNKAWREFEELVATIELQAAPRGATVVSPDRVRDRVTGRMREVDVSIRFKIGTTEILIALECRKRGRKADDTWIEQIATKKSRIGASKMIAVSSAGFTSSAIRSAREVGIELRTLSAISTEVVQDWFLPQGIVHIFRSIDRLGCHLELIDGQCVEIADPMDPVFLHSLVHAPFPPAALINFLELKEPRRFWSVPLDGSRSPFIIEIDATAEDLIPVPLGTPRPPQCDLAVQIGDQTIVVLKITLRVELSYHTTALEANEGSHHVYQDTHGEALVRHSRFSGEVFGLPVIFDHQSDVTGSTASVEFQSGLRLESSWVGVDEETLHRVRKYSSDAEALQRSDLALQTHRSCGLCRKVVFLEANNVVPQFLVPPGAPIPKERLFCISCSGLIDSFDTFGKLAENSLPREGLKPYEGKYLLFENPDYRQLRLWLLSLLWRIHLASAPIWAGIDLGSESEKIRDMLVAFEPPDPGYFPADCTIPSFDGQRFQIVLQPDIVNTGSGRVLRAVLGGLVFTFSLERFGEKTEFSIQPDRPWYVAVLPWRDIDFLRHWVENRRLENINS